MQLLSSRIDSVTVYAGAARVRRVAEVVAPGEPVTVRLGGLPLALRDASVRLSAEGPIIAADARVVVEVPEHDDLLPPADPQALDDARRQVGLLELDQARIVRALEALVALTPGVRPERPHDPLPAWSTVVEARLALMTVRGERERALRTEHAASAQALVAARRRLERAEDEHRRATTARAAAPDELRKALVMTVRPAPGGDGGDGRGLIVVEYVVPGARWAPSYVARLGDGAARLELRAVIAQQTGEDWRGVRLALSTAAAQTWTELPELPSVRIGRRQPPPPRAGWKAPPAGAELLYADWDRAFAGKVALPRAPRAQPTMMFAEPAPLDGLFEEDLDESTLTVTPVAGAPGGPSPRQAMAPPMPASAPMSMMAPQSKSRSGGLGAAIGGLVAAPAALVAAGAGAVARTMSRSDKGMAEQARGGAGAPELDAEIVAPADLLAYGDLRMPPASSPQRGRLVRAERRDLYLAVLVSQQVTLSFDVLGAIHTAEQRAAAAARRTPPPGTTASWSDSYDYAFTADGAVEIPSDGIWHAIALGEAAAPVEVRHVVAPRESTDVFRLARLDNPHDAPLLPGPMDVYDGRDFLLTTQVGFTAPRGHVEVGLGVDQQVKVARNSRYREETAGMLRGSLRLEHEVEIEVENLGARTVQLEVRERLPVRAIDDDDIEIAVDRVTPAWQPWTPEPESPGEPRLRGGQRWQVALGPGAKQTLEVHYHVKIAGKNELVGGNRRES